jgi:2-polyprenyl-3-methyl-5-hydroxy-6-metoxy-1,4-benzoquinol methylase
MSFSAGVAVETAENQGYRANPRRDVLELLPRLKPGIKVLEVGCGEGGFCLAIPEATERWGIEPEPRAAEIATTRLHRVFVNTFDAIKPELPLNYFDLVVCNDVIEHMTDHDAFLRSVQDHMVPGSYIVGSLPNVRYYSNLFNLIAARDWHYKDSGVLDRTHFRFFTQRSVRRSLEEAGFAVSQVTGLNRMYSPGWRLRTVAERLFRDALILLSAGAARDIRYLQIGFVARRRLQAGE